MHPVYVTFYCTSRISYAGASQAPTECKRFVMEVCTWNNERKTVKRKVGGGLICLLLNVLTS